MSRLAAVCIEALVQQRPTDDRIWVLDGDLADSYGAVSFAEAYPDRFVMSGIAEQNMVSMAAGMAACGARPFVFSFAAFLAYRAADQVRVCLSQTGLPVTLIASHSGGCGGRNGKTHQAIADLAVIASLPGMTVWTPADPADAVHAVGAVLAGTGPAYIRTPREACPALPGTPGPLRWLTCPGADVLVCTGLSAHWALEIKGRLGSHGHGLGVLHVGRLRPLPAALSGILRRARRWYVIEDHVRLGGLAEAASIDAGRQPDDWFGWPADWTGGSGDAHDLRALCSLDAGSVADVLMRSLEPIA